MIKVFYDKPTRTFYASHSTEDRHTLEKAGWLFSPINRRFETKNKAVAIRLASHFDETAKNQISLTSILVEPRPGGLPLKNLHPAHLTPLPHQLEGVEFILDRNHSYIAFEQGLGKTATAIMAINVLKAPTLIIAPPHLVENWKKELATWLTWGSYSEKGDPAHITIVADSMLDKTATYLANCHFDFVVVDEAHRFKNLKTGRTKALARILPLIERRALLSGTPVPNRPIELFAPLSMCAHNLIQFMDEHQFGLKYCAGVKTKWGWEYKGASHLIDLHRRIVDVYLLRKDKSEMKGLPKKITRMVRLSATREEMRKLEKDIRAKYGQNVPTLFKYRHLGPAVSYRRAVGLKKVGAALAYISDVLASTTESLLVFGFHTEVLEALHEGLPGSKLIYGATSMRRRDEIISEFQNGESRVLVAQISTMVGYNITRATRGIFVEPMWSPGDNDQAADRMHRMGQTDAVTLDFLSLAHSLDEKILNTITLKQNHITQLLG